MAQYTKTIQILKIMLYMVLLMIIPISLIYSCIFALSYSLKIIIALPNLSIIKPHSFSMFSLIAQLCSLYTTLSNYWTLQLHHLSCFLRQAGVILIASLSSTLQSKSDLKYQGWRIAWSFSFGNAVPYMIRTEYSSQSQSSCDHNYPVQLTQSTNEING